MASANTRIITRQPISRVCSPGRCQKVNTRPSQSDRGPRGGLGRSGGTGQEREGTGVARGTGVVDPPGGLAPSVPTFMPNGPDGRRRAWARRVCQPTADTGLMRSDEAN